MEHLLPKIDGMLPEGVGKRSAFVKTGPAARLTNELLENAKLTVDKLWKQRGYEVIKEPEVIKARLGYACDQYEASAYLVTGALHMPLISHEEAKFIGKRIQNIVGKSGSIGKQLVPLRKRGAASAPQVRALLQQAAAMSFAPPPRTVPAPAPEPGPELPPPPSPPPAAAASRAGTAAAAATNCTARPSCRPHGVRAPARTVRRWLDGHRRLSRRVQRRGDLLGPSAAAVRALRLQARVLVLLEARS